MVDIPDSTTLFLQKLLNRQKQFQKCNLDWSSQRKERIEYILSKGLTYISSEESGDDEDGKPIYFRRPLEWLGKKYRKSLRSLDNLYYNSLKSNYNVH